MEVVGEPLSDEQRSQAHLPTTLGGLSWPDLPAEVILGRLAGMIEIGPALRESIRERNPRADLDDIKHMDGVDLEPDLFDFAAALGVVPGPAGLPAAAPTKDPLRAPVPARHLLSSYVHAAGKHRFQQLWANLAAPVC